MQRKTGNETSKMYKKIQPFLRGKGIDIGCGPWPLDYPNLDTLDIAPEVNSTILARAEKIPMPNETYDFVYSSHCLEHVKCPKKVLKEWIRILKPGGLLILILPHKYFYHNVRDKKGNASHWYDFRPEDVILMLRQIKQTYLIETGILVEQVVPRWQGKIEYSLRKEFNQYSFYMVACKKKCFESFFIESWLNKFSKIKPALKNKLKILCQKIFPFGKNAYVLL
ncbi:hypothetical protein CL633_01645 [bacterium]|nr:hypothetical protein [bacterium]|tara:strand:+ start:2006 stop:2677 length:672 start_codon:yes stop_codon:yes gene_type:complete